MVGLTLLSICLFSTITVLVNGLPSHLEPVVFPRSTDDTRIPQFAKIGQCFKYISIQQRNVAKSVAPCNIYCAETSPGVNGASCAFYEGVTEEYWIKDTSVILKDDDGYQFVVGQCTCGGAIVELAEEIAGVVAEALEQLDNLLCGILLQAFATLAEIMVNVIPGGQVLTAVKMSVRAAKSFAENGLEAAEFGNWVGKACGAPDINFDPLQTFDPVKVFEPLIEVPDEFGVSVGCKRKVKSGCKEIPPVASPPKKSDPASPKPTGVESDFDLSTKTGMPSSDSGLASESRVVSSSNRGSEGASTTSSISNSEESSTSSANSGDSSSTFVSSPGPVGTTDVASSSVSSDTASESNSACGLSKRAKSPKNRVGVVGEDETSTECGKKGEKTVHVTKTAAPIGFYTSILPQKCPREFSQACYHYRSVMSVHTNTPDMVQWTCGATAGTSEKGKATDNWGSTALAPRKGNPQHNFAWANGFVALEIKKNKKGTNVARGCDRDEWPPRYFWPGDPAAIAKGMSQRIRFIPAADNQGAGKIWAQFCNRSGAQSTQVRTIMKIATTTYYINSKWIETVGPATVDKPSVSGLITTVVSTVSVNTGRAIFTIGDWDGLPDDKEWHGLKENKCWPQALAAEDPGWALLTEDEFYKAGQHPLLAVHTKSYEGFPDVNILKAKISNLDAKNEVRPLTPAKALEIFGEDGIPEEFQGILPGIPIFSTPKPPPRLRRGIIFPGVNITILPGGIPFVLPGGSEISTPEEDEALIDGEDEFEDPEAKERLMDFPADSGDVDLEGLDEQALAQWMQEYVQFGKREEGQVSPTENEAVATAAGQFIATGVPAIEGKSASAGQPVATTFIS